MKVNILDTLVDNVNMAEAVATVKEYIEAKKPRQIITLNAEIIYHAQTDVALKEAINASDLVTPDGSGVLLAGKILNNPLQERVTGIDLMQELLKEANKTGWRLYFFGAAPGVAQEAAEKSQEKYASLKIVGTSHGFVSQEDMPALLEDIKAKKPDILFVALGAPRQEFWIRKYKDALGVPVSIGVGGSLDVLAGRVKRAPKTFQNLKLEWLYRLLKEPWRFKRMQVLPKFILKVWQAKNK